MGKDKEQKTEAPGSAFTRMNYLYQAGQLMTELSSNTSLSNYYNKVMKEISKKIVEKLHPDLKRTICVACNQPLTTGSNQINVKLKSVRKKRKKKKIKLKEKETQSEEKKQGKMFKASNNDSVIKYRRSRLEVRDRRPNRISWSCCKCNFTKEYLLKPSYKLWIHKIENSSSQS